MPDFFFEELFQRQKPTCFVKSNLGSKRENSREKGPNLRANILPFVLSKSTSQNALFIGILGGSKFSPVKKFILSCVSKISLRREFSFSPVS
ncbi:hypothetical protein PORCRE_42 [Porphyromonas crevioricanis JCM 15906]|uniref:Uncharacterized protein n=1 Tax=Porphyromonas crevioricanis JCM 15906 TaxID=1305617 RepID=S4PFV7_9PORP|nr:hypothetical protein PORCRE_42 [Porphyromonas crevioricanis JCM 15906]